jgi:GGDEF domain-containing protein
LAVLVITLAATASIVTYLLLSLRRTLHLEFLTTSLRQATDELQAESEKATHLARHDSLTGLANRATFNERLLAMFQAAKSGGKHFAVICMDLDHFKDVNDTLGHPCGDRLLQITADRLEPIVGDGDIVARLGGDEFAILLPRTVSSRS